MLGKEIEREKEREKRNIAIYHEMNIRRLRPIQFIMSIYYAIIDNRKINNGNGD
jgi:hypothetical protein